MDTIDMIKQILVMYCDVCNKKIEDGVSFGNTIDEITDVHYCSFKCKKIDSR